MHIGPQGEEKRTPLRPESGKEAMPFMKKILLFLTALCLFLSSVTVPMTAAEEETDTSFDEPAQPSAQPESAEAAALPSEGPTPREELINRIIETGRKLYDAANGRLQRAHYAGDIYVCKNFTVHVFRENSADFRLAEYPDVPLIVPNNLPKEDCKPYYYGYCWMDVGPDQGNPFYIAAQFVYDKNQSKQANMERALEFMRQVKRGDYFQMSADYKYGVGAHSAIMIADYDPDADTVHWMDSNMIGEKRNNIRYGKVQFDAVKDISWWAEAFCKKGRGATIYRLRDDIVFVGQ